MRRTAWQFLKDFFGGGNTITVQQKLQTEQFKLNIEDFAIQMAINLIAGTIGKCEFKTYSGGKPIKGDEYYLWNVEPNVNQNSSQFLQELVSKLLWNNECLVVPVNGQLIIADDFFHNEYALYPDTFTQVSRGSLTFEKTFYMQDVLYFRLGHDDIRVLLSGLINGYSELLNMAVGKYKRSGGRKGIARLSSNAEGNEEFKKKVDELFNKRFKSYFESENAVVTIPNGIDYQEQNGEGNKKTTSEINDVVNLTKEIIWQVARAFRIPPALLQGDIADVDKITDNFITFCIDMFCDLIQTEVNRKRYGKSAFLKGVFLRIDTTRIKRADIFDVAEKADKLIACGAYSVDEIREKIGDMPLNTWWSQKHWLTKNYEEIEAAESPPKKGMKELYGIKKSGSITGLTVDSAELEAINKFALEPLTAEEVFAFKMTACGNDIDRDGEAFTESALEKLAELFVGKTVMQDHDPKAENQKARIYRAEVIRDGTTAKTGEPYAQLIAYCYMVKTSSNQDYITEIKAGIKKEVSVGCNVGKVVCSICGKNNLETSCGHKSGKEYGGKICYRKLEEPKDAYEISFVAVPAQREAGVTKDYGGKPEQVHTTIAELLKTAFQKTEE